MSAPLKTAVLARKAAELAVERVLEAEYPVGAPIRWVNQRKEARLSAHDGVVVAHRYGGNRIRVRNARTDKTIDIRVWQILDAMELEEGR